MLETPAAPPPRAPSEAAVPAPLPAAAARPLWKEPSVRWLLFAVFALQLLSLFLQRGYPLADAVEFMDRALILVSGQPPSDAHTVRSFAFSTLFVPLFGLARAFGMEDLRPLLWVAQGLQMVIGLGLVLAVVRLGVSLAGLTTGIVAGALVGTNPVFLVFSIHPVSGLAAGLFVALGLSAVIERRSARSGALAGLWFGLAFLMAYQSLVLALGVLVVLVLRDRIQHRRCWLAFGAALSAAFVVQVLLDKAVYGRWGGSFGRYVFENVGAVVTRWLWESGYQDAAKKVYDLAQSLRGSAEGAGDPTKPMRQLQGHTWYLVNLPTMIVWPAIVLGAIALWRALTDLRWKSTLLVFVFVLNVAVLSSKGAKSYRLWLPLLPLIAPLCAWGWVWLAQIGARHVSWTRRAVALVLLVSVVPLSLDAFRARDLRYHSGYWDAIDWVNETVEAERAAVEGAFESQRLASAYHWAVFLRNSPDVEIVKTPHLLDQWQLLSEVQRERVLSALDTVDWFIVHVPVFQEYPELVDYLNTRFDVRAAFYDQDLYADLGPVLVLHARDGRGESFFDLFPDGLPEDHALVRADRVPTHFRREGIADNREHIVFLGSEYESLPGSGWGWITYYWRAESTIAHDYEIADRVTGPDDSNSWQNNHFPAWGVMRARDWKRGLVMSEGYLLVPAAVDEAERERFRPLGGAYRRGDLIPARLWMEIRAQARTGELLELEPWDPASAEYSRERLEPDRYWALDGTRFTRDGLVRVDSFYLPVHPRAAVPDDGKPLDP